MTKRKLDQLKWEVLPHPPYSPDLAPSDFKLFRSLQNALRGMEFADEGEILDFVGDFFKSRAPRFFVHAFTDLVWRWEAVIENEGEYAMDE